MTLSRTLKVCHDCMTTPDGKEREHLTMPVFDGECQICKAEGPRKLTRIAFQEWIDAKSLAWSKAWIDNFEDDLWG